MNFLRLLIFISLVMPVIANAQDSESYEYESGNIDLALFCGNELEGFEVFLSDDRINYKVLNITGREDFLRLRMDNQSFKSLIVPIRNSSPVYDAMIRTYFVDKYPEFYHISRNDYLNWYDYGPGGNSAWLAAPDYVLFRDGSGLGISPDREAFNEDLRVAHPDSLVENAELEAQPCSIIEDAEADALLAERLSGFGVFMKNKYNEKLEEIKKVEESAKF